MDDGTNGVAFVGEGVAGEDEVITVSFGGNTTIGDNGVIVDCGNGGTRTGSDIGARTSVGGGANGGGMAWDTTGVSTVSLRPDICSCNKWIYSIHTTQTN